MLGQADFRLRSAPTSRRWTRVCSGPSRWGWSQARPQAMVRIATDARILIERDGTTLTLTLNRPDKLNAIDGAMLDALGEALAEIERDRTARGDPDRRRACVQRRRGHQGVDGARAARVRAQLGPARPCPVRSLRRCRRR